MEARILQGRDDKRYMALRTQAANERSAQSTLDLERELFLFADHSTAVIAQHGLQGTVVWGAYDGRALVGTLALSRQLGIADACYLWLWGLYVRPRYRGTPASRLLMEAMLAWCEGEPMDRRLLSSFEPSNHRGRLFLGRWGFERADAIPDPYLWKCVGDRVLVERERGPL